jgi:hypothetical protein
MPPGPLASEQHAGARARRSMRLAFAAKGSIRATQRLLQHGHVCGIAAAAQHVARCLMPPALPRALPLPLPLPRTSCVLQA